MAKIIEELIVKLTPKGMEDVNQAVDKTGKKTKETGQQMEKVSKRFGLAFKGAGLFAVGLFTAVLKGGPVTARFLSNIWQSIGLLGDTLLQKAGAWKVLQEITNGILAMNKAIATGDMRFFGEVLKMMAGDLMRVMATLLLPVPLPLLLQIDTIKEKFGGLKTFLAETLTSIVDSAVSSFDTLKTKLSEKLIQIKTGINGKMSEIKQMLHLWWTSIKDMVLRIVDTLQTEIQKKFDAIKAEYDKLKAYVEKPITIVRNIITNTVGKLTGRQVGGQVSAGKSFLVGERGPEIFTPASSGRITPNNKLGGMGGSGDVVIPIRLEMDSRTVWEGVKRVSGIDLRRFGGM